jgi:hypothetical protein
VMASPARPAARRMGRGTLRAGWLRRASFVGLLVTSVRLAVRLVLWQRDGTVCYGELCARLPEPFS